MSAQTIRNLKKWAAGAIALSAFGLTALNAQTAGSSSGGGATAPTTEPQRNVSTATSAAVVGDEAAPPAEKQPRKIAAGDTLAVYVAAVLDGADGKPPVYTPANEPPVIGYPMRVRDDGTLSLPLVQPVKVLGLTTLECEEKLHAAYKGVVARGQKSTWITVNFIGRPPRSGLSGGMRGGMTSGMTSGGFGPAGGFGNLPSSLAPTTSVASTGTGGSSAAPAMVGFGGQGGRGGVAAANLPTGQATIASDWNVVTQTIGPSSGLLGMASTGASRKADLLEGNARTWFQQSANAKDDAQRQEAERKGRELLRQVFEERIAAQEKEISELEARLSKMRERMSKRKAAKEELIESRAKLLTDEASGEGFPSGSNPVRSTSPGYGSGGGATTFGRGSSSGGFPPTPSQASTTSPADAQPAKTSKASTPSPK